MRRRYKELRLNWLLRLERKILALSHGIYTIIYLGPTLAVTKDLLWEKTLLLEKRLRVFWKKRRTTWGILISCGR